MYFPYLRGKQQELIALRDALPIIKKGKVLPIVEPVGDGNSPKKSLVMLGELKLPIIFIVNPQVGQLKTNHEKVTKLFDIINQNMYTIPAFIVHAGSTTADIGKFFTHYANQQKSLIHLYGLRDQLSLIDMCKKQKNFAHHIFIVGKTSDSYNDQFKEFQRILIEDGFNREKASRNADRSPDNLFSELHSVYKRRGYAGYGDFTITGEEYTEKGGAAHAVAIHLTFRSKSDLQDEIRIKNFVSDRTKGTADPAGKYLEAARKLVKFADDPHSKLYRSTAVEKFIETVTQKKFPGLASVKGWSIRHHIELMASL